MSHSSGEGLAIVALILSASLWTLPIGWTNGQHYCTSATVGTSSCTLPQNGCDGVLRGYGRCEEGTQTVPVSSNQISGSSTITFATPFTNTPAVADITTTGASLFLIAQQYTQSLFSGNTTWFSVPQTAWTELFGSSDWEVQANSYVSTVSSGVALGLGCKNCTGFENFGLEYSTNQALWHNVLNFTISSIPSGGTTNSARSAFTTPGTAIPTGSWWRVTVENQSGASESIVLNNVYVIVQIQLNENPLTNPGTISKTSFVLTVIMLLRTTNTLSFVVNWKVNVAAG